MKIGIVGGAGQIGRGLLRAFRQHPGISAFGITRNAMSAGPLLAEGFDIRVGSVAGGTTARELLQGADVVVNCALEIDRPKRARARNEALVSGLLEHAHAALVIHLSSVAVYGSCVDRTVSTFERPRPDSTYGREKLRLERFAQSVAPRHRQPLLILRLGHVYGPGQGISREAFDVLKTGQWTLPFDGALPSNAVHIDHLAAAIPVMADRADGGVVLNATDSPQRTWRQLYDLHAEAAGAPRLPSMADEDAERRRDSYRRQARLSLLRRVPEQVTQWARRLPLKSLVSVTAVRQATEAALLALPAGVERLVDRRYVVFSAGLHMETAAGTDGPPPWFYSDGVDGPGLRAVAESDERTTREVAELRAWHSSWAAPAWRVAVPGREHA
jgi:nucleoside-diphosphate-sugar epimerase